LDDKTGHVTIYFKICNKDVIDSITGKLIFNEDKDGPNLHSGNNCYPLGMFLLKDNKKLYNIYVRMIFEDVNILRTEDVTKLGWLPFNIMEPQDTKSFQLCLGRGGACKGTNYFCHMCQLHSDSVQLPNQVACEKCEHALSPTVKKKCYCQPMHDKQ
jgi:hypothetical protein